MSASSSATSTRVVAIAGSYLLLPEVTPCFFPPLPTYGASPEQKGRISPMHSTSMKIFATIAAVGAVSVAAIGGTYANFAASPTTITSNAFATGSLQMSRTGSGAIFDLGPAKIGEEATGSVTITNTGTLAGQYTLAGTTTGSAVLASQLRLVIYKNTDGAAGSKLYDGTLGAFSSADLGTFAASGGANTYYFHVTLPTTGTDAGDNALQGLATATSFTWSAVQA